MATDNTVEIGFTADTSGLTSGMEEASEAVAALQASMAQTNAAFASTASSDYVKSLQSAVGATRDLSQANQAFDDQSRKLAFAQIATERLMIAQKKTLGETSADDAVAQLKDLAAQEDAINQQRLLSMKSAYAEQGDFGDTKQIGVEQQLQTERYTQQITKLNTEAAQQSQAAWQKAFQPISKAFESSIDGMVRGTQTLDQTVRRAAQNIVAEYANSAVQSALRWVEGEAQKTAASLAGDTARTASTQSASTEGIAIEGAANKESVVGNAWSAAAAVYNNVAQIPYVGWVLAPAAAASAAAAVLAFGGSIPSAAGGWVVPNDTLAMVHENEMVLPAHLSQGLSSMIAGGGSGQAGHTFNNTFNLGGVQPRDIPSMIDAHIRKQARNGAYGGMRAT